MTKKFWALCAVIVMSAAFGCASGGPKVSVAPDFVPKDPGIEMVNVKGGCFQMGNLFEDEDDISFPNELPVHEVCVDGFYIGKYEVTQGQWKSVMGSNTSDPSICNDDNCPMMNVSWNEVQDFISRLNSLSGGKKYRLPTEAEWEYAARSGGKRERFSGGNDVDSVAWYSGNSRGPEKKFRKVNFPVGTKAPNGLGVYDMSGNVWEMTSDWYEGDYYSKSPRNNPTGPTSGIDRVMRGGCTTGGIENQRTSRRSDLGLQAGGDSSWSTGFRLARTP